VSKAIQKDTRSVRQNHKDYSNLCFEQMPSFEIEKATPKGSGFAKAIVPQHKHITQKQDTA